jgi:prepilin-type N-terminal cleavage/methylation domain-containing protein
MAIPSSHPAREKGFTLVELAIALTVIGLLLAGVLKGEELIQTARVNQTIKQMQSYRSAVAQFFDTYTALPGDFSSATTRIANCNDSFCVNGDGNKALPPNAGQSDQSVTSFAAGTENSSFWYQLAYAGLINLDLIDIYSFPMMRAPIGPHACIVAATYNIGTPANFGTYLLYRNCLESQAATTTFAPWGPAAMSAKDAYAIDKKMDDGLPSTGDVMDTSWGAYSSPYCNSATAYFPSQQGIMCALAVKVANKGGL